MPRVVFFGIPLDSDCPHHSQQLILEILLQDSINQLQQQVLDELALHQMLSITLIVQSPW